MKKTNLKNIQELSMLLGVYMSGASQLFCDEIKESMLNKYGHGEYNDHPGIAAEHIIKCCFTPEGVLCDRYRQLIY